MLDMEKQLVDASSVVDIHNRTKETLKRYFKQYIIEYMEKDILLGFDVFVMDVYDILNYLNTIPTKDIEIDYTDLKISMVSDIVDSLNDEFEINGWDIYMCKSITGNDKIRVQYLGLERE